VTGCWARVSGCHPERLGWAGNGVGWAGGLSGLRASARASADDGQAGRLGGVWAAGRLRPQAFAQDGSGRRLGGWDAGTKKGSLAAPLGCGLSAQDAPSPF
jgi:hypothetical protein